MKGDCCDDSNVLTHLIIQESLGLIISTDRDEAALSHYLLRTRQDEDRNLVAELENVWAYNNNGELWGDKALELNNAE